MKRILRKTLRYDIDIFDRATTLFYNQEMPFELFSGFTLLMIGLFCAHNTIKKTIHSIIS